MVEADKKDDIDYDHGTQNNADDAAKQRRLYRIVSPRPKDS